MNLIKFLKRKYGEHQYKEFKSDKAGSRFLKAYWEGRKDSIQEVLNFILNGDKEKEGK